MLNDDVYDRLCPWNFSLNDHGCPSGELYRISDGFKIPQVNGGGSVSHPREGCRGGLFSLGSLWAFVTQTDPLTDHRIYRQIPKNIVKKEDDECALPFESFSIF